MRSATLRGLMYHTADEAGIADGPDQDLDGDSLMRKQQ
jgi:hypothetical protein